MKLIFTHLAICFLLVSFVNAQCVAVPQLIDGDLIGEGVADSVFVDFDFDGSDDSVYAGNKCGRFYRSFNESNQDPADVEIVFDLNNDNETAPVVHKAAYGNSVDAGEVRIFFGTGDCCDCNSPVNTGPHYLLSVKDSNEFPVSGIPLGDLSAKSVEIITREVDGIDKSYKIVTGDETDLYGWYVVLSDSLDGYERLTAPAVVVGGIVFFATFVADSSDCMGGGQAWLYGLDFSSGLSAEIPVFDIDEDGLFNINDTVSLAENALVVSAVQVGDFIPRNLVQSEQTIVITSSTGSENIINVNIPALRTQVRSWQELGL